MSSSDLRSPGDSIQVTKFLRISQRILRNRVRGGKKHKTSSQDKQREVEQSRRAQSSADLASEDKGAVTRRSSSGMSCFGSWSPSRLSEQRFRWIWDSPGARPADACGRQEQKLCLQAHLAHILIDRDNAGVWRL